MKFPFVSRKKYELLEFVGELDAERAICVDERNAELAISLSEVRRQLAWTRNQLLEMEWSAQGLD